MFILAQICNTSNMYDSFNMGLRNKIQWPNNKIIIIIILFIFEQICDTSNVYDNINLGRRNEIQWPNNEIIIIILFIFA